MWITRKVMSVTIFTATAASLALAAAGQQPREMQKVSLGGIINQETDDTLAFTPDGKTVFFDRSEGSRKTIMVSRKIQGRWSEAEVASFSGQWFDQNPIVSPDGRYLLFNSNRPPQPGGRPLVQTYFSKSAAPGSNIWRVDRRTNGWGQPRWLGARINSDVFIDFASIAGDNAIYFMRVDVQNRVMQLWRANYRHGDYTPPERVLLGDPMVSIHDPAVASDQSFIVFDYGRVTGGLGRLSIAFRDGGHWSDPIDLGDLVNADIPWGAHLSPNQRSAYVTGQSGIWRLDLTPWLNRRHAN